VATFLGTYEHSLDEKGRVILPSKFRAPFEHGGYISEYLDGCLALWTPDEFEIQVESMKEQAKTGQRDRKRARLWASTSYEMDLDKQGRIPIPAALRRYARLDSEVLVLGAIERVELWNRENWETKVLPEEESLTSGEDN
jgi:MraZ protein